MMERDEFNVLSETEEFSTVCPESEFTPPISEFSTTSTSVFPVKKKKKKKRLFLVAAVAMLSLMIYGTHSATPNPSNPKPPVDDGIPKIETFFVQFSSLAEGRIVISNPKHIDALRVEMWNQTANSLVDAWDVTKQEMAEGSFTLPVIDIYPLYLESGLDEWPTLELHVSMDYSIGSEVKKESFTEPLLEGDGWGLTYHAEHLEPSNWIHPGCFVFVPYEDVITKDRICIDDTIDPNKITIRGEIGGHSLVDLDYRIEVVKEQYTIGDTDEVHEVERTLVVITRPSDVIEGSGTAHFVVTQPIVGKTSLWEKVVDVPY